MSTPDLKTEGEPGARAGDGKTLAAQIERARALAAQFRSHPASRSIDEIEEAGELLYTLAAAPAVSAPAGYKLVPLEPTDAMLDVDYSFSLSSRFNRRIVWHAMLAASPAAPAPARRADLAQRVTDYLSGGGLFNPELANHDAVRNLLIECRDAFQGPATESSHERDEARIDAVAPRHSQPSTARRLRSPNG
ncbi:MAG: hypothetical protein EOP35_18210 [Rubrivivax sp.]|nr:MAG: hypothetical protein EOP35_18210 [Rubrivivax sp.]